MVIITIEPLSTFARVQGSSAISKHRLNEVHGVLSRVVCVCKDVSMCVHMEASTHTTHTATLVQVRQKKLSRLKLQTNLRPSLQSWVTITCVFVSFPVTSLTTI